MANKRRILVLAPHTDDGELGCGAAIARFVEQGAEVHYVAFSTAKESVPAGLPENILEVEVREATRRLGILPENLHVFGYTVRKLSYVRQDILEDMVKLRNALSPDLVLMPSRNDLHQDHSTVASEALRAFKNTSILAYELPWNTIDFSTQGFVVVEPRHVDRKIEALAAYGSQKMRKYMDPEYVRGWARTRGVQIGRDFAEAFEVIRWIL
ncbi:MAG TPA: PIG-L family deacetylase [Spirochaetia bacterium]|nr:PIG-L family deacetylase [Spirochaetales bacterium]HRY80423.1 PIG-L family deacetylase [Spirochaetia bacterium]